MKNLPIHDKNRSLAGCFKKPEKGKVSLILPVTDVTLNTHLAGLKTIGEPCLKMLKEYGFTVGANPSIHVGTSNSNEEKSQSLFVEIIYRHESEGNKNIFVSRQAMFDMHQEDGRPFLRLVDVMTICRDDFRSVDIKDVSDLDNAVRLWNSFDEKP